MRSTRNGRLGSRLKGPRTSGTIDLPTAGVPPHQVPMLAPGYPPSLARPWYPHVSIPASQSINAPSSSYSSQVPAIYQHATDQVFPMPFPSSNPVVSAPSVSLDKPSKPLGSLHGYGETAALCERVIMALYSCSAIPAPYTSDPPIGGGTSPRSSTHPSKQPPRLNAFVAYALYRTRLPSPVTYQALFLLKRLKQRFPSARGSSGHRLFISAMILASKSLCDDTFSNKSWVVVAQDMFSLHDINTMEYELFGFLGYEVNVPAQELSLFTELLQQGRLDQALYIPPLRSSPASDTSSSFATSSPSTSMHRIDSNSLTSEPSVHDRAQLAVQTLSIRSPRHLSAPPTTRSTRSSSSPLRSAMDRAAGLQGQSLKASQTYRGPAAAPLASGLPAAWDYHEPLATAAMAAIPSPPQSSTRSSLRTRADQCTLSSSPPKLVHTVLPSPTRSGPSADSYLHPDSPLFLAPSAPRHRYHFPSRRPSSDSASVALGSIKTPLTDMSIDHEQESWSIQAKVGQPSPLVPMSVDRGRDGPLAL